VTLVEFPPKLLALLNPGAKAARQVILSAIANAQSAGAP
jgi:hypothetical protein